MKEDLLKIRHNYLPKASRSSLSFATPFFNHDMIVGASCIALQLIDAFQHVGCPKFHFFNFSGKIAKLADANTTSTLPTL